MVSFGLRVSRSVSAPISPSPHFDNAISQSTQTAYPVPAHSLCLETATGFYQTFWVPSGFHLVYKHFHEHTHEVKLLSAYFDTNFDASVDAPPTCSKKS